MGGLQSGLLMSSGAVKKLFAPNSGSSVHYTVTIVLSDALSKCAAFQSRLNSGTGHVDISTTARTRATCASTYFNPEPCRLPII